MAMQGFDPKWRDLPDYIPGFTHAEFGPWGLKREYTLFDEISVWKQILLHRGEGD